MRRLSLALISTVSALAFTQIASAADLPTKAPAYMPPPPPVMTWNGFYIGLNAGWHWDNGSFDSVGTPSFANPNFLAGSQAVAGALAGIGTYSFGNNNNNGGFIGGGQIGYNWQFGTWVAGLETDIQWLDHHDNADSQTVTVNLVGFPEHYTAVQSAERQVDWLGTFRGRIGFLATPAFLAYVTGGLAYGGVKSSASVSAQESLGPATYPPVFGGIDLSDTRVGWTVGGGVEWMFAPQWSLKGEYLYYDLGSMDGSYTLQQNCAPAACAGLPAGGLWAAATVNTHTEFKGSIARAGINYHF